MKTVRIAARYNGPPRVVNGGVACGTLAAELGGSVEATLWRPVPVDTDLALTRDGDAVALRDAAGEVLAEARPAELAAADPEPVSIAAAERAMAASPAQDASDALFPCFVCSPHRSDGLQLSAGPVADRDAVAAVWRPDAALADADGRVRDVFSWGVLDCTGSIAAMHAAARSDGVLLGRMTAQVLEAPRVGDTLVAVGWAEPPDGRKLPAGSLLLRDGRVVARARLVTFAPRG